MVIDGNLIARELRDEIKARASAHMRRLKLGLVVAHETPEIRKFLSLKQRFGADVGIQTDEIALDSIHQKTESLLQLILHASREYDGLVLQLPLPHSFDLESVLRLFPLTHDVDVVGHTAYEQFKEATLPFVPPVVAAMAEILHRQGVRLAGRRVLIIGQGRLVGAPAEVWATRLGATVKSVGKDTGQFDDWVRGADVVICGAGSPGVVRPDNIKEGAIILDAGTSESEGVLKGDADPACAEKAFLFTPTPGGIGPVTVAKVFENLLTLVELKATRSA